MILVRWKEKWILQLNSISNIAVVSLLPSQHHAHWSCRVNRMETCHENKKEKCVKIKRYTASLHAKAISCCRGHIDSRNVLNEETLTLNNIPCAYTIQKTNGFHSYERYDQPNQTLSHCHHSRNSNHIMGNESQFCCNKYLHKGLKYERDHLLCRQRPGIFQSNRTLYDQMISKQNTVIGARSFGTVFVQPCRTYIKRIETNDEEFVNEAGIKQFLNENDMPFEPGYTSFITQCPKHRRKLKPNSTDCLYVNFKTGYFVCQSCKKTGSWPTLQDNIKLLTAHLKEKKKNRKQFECFEDIEDEGKIHSPRLIQIWENSSGFDSMLSLEVEPLLHNISIQKLHKSFLRKYEVRMSISNEAVFLPYYSVDCQLIGIKTVTVVESKRNKHKLTMKTIPKSDLGSVFGWNTITPTMTEVVITANEFDAIAVNQETKLPALALPKGDSILPQQVLPLLEQFKKIILWFGNDVRSWEMAKQFSKKLNEKRCYLIRPGDDMPNALAALDRGLPFMKILKGGRPVLHDSIISFGQMRQELYSHFAQGERVAGIKWKRFPQLNNLLKGFRRGELTVFTGPTGSGKTTFISDYSLDLCIQGVNTLWGSFEINNVRLLSTIMCQFAQMDLMKHLDQFHTWADQFEQLSMYFMNFHGQESINKVIETMSHAVYVHDIAHVIVDNLQFMMGVEMYGNSDRFLKQDSIVSAFRRFATQMNCHVTLVIHPRKERDSEDLTVASVFGSAKATQEADNVLILQDKRLTEYRGRKYVQVAKNRFDGELGVMLLKFDKSSLSFSSKEKKKAMKKKTDTTEVVDHHDDGNVNTHHGDDTDTQGTHSNKARDSLLEMADEELSRRMYGDHDNDENKDGSDDPTL